ncbi:hypothetical protein HMI54_000826 [Coelomomyces lativittatus]|nr:hypothetical protein HMI55_006877 [Coelomomyces lativittatus]KAJ1510922.1 hypothetical protein HMI56_006037 [Coelomomyces lativittatus]KAJ1518421.1 hypothetical protein HMI54_000826 [Coelomomyces lativittatus]
MSASASPSLPTSDPTTTTTSPSDQSNAIEEPSTLTSTSDLVEFATSQLAMLEKKFNERSSLILKKIENMGTKLTDLEQSIHELMDQSALMSSDTSLPTSVALESNEKEI